jgi:hypothetical protein
VTEVKTSLAEDKQVPLFQDGVLLLYLLWDVHMLRNTVSIPTIQWRMYTLRGFEALISALCLQVLSRQVPYGSITCLWNLGTAFTVTNCR